MALQPWEGSARIYDVLYGEMKDYEADVQRLHTWIQARRPGARNLLDVACGTGLHLSRLRQFYDPVVGIDLSEEMLQIAEQRLEGVPLHRGDMRTFDLGEQFDAVTCLFSAIGYMATSKDLGAAVANMASHLAPGGVLVVEPWLDVEGWMDGHLDLMTYESEDLKVARMSSGDRDGSRVTIHFHHMVMTPDGVNYFAEDHPTSLFSKDEYRTAMEDAGLDVEYDPEGFIGRGMWFGVKSAASSQQPAASKN
ncbi:MAG: class I SAM-dependent methyltransferase [Pirellulales bacterium]|nr:class I SAM-dependent methyltransferase [Pirellulales bacterium]